MSSADSGFDMEIRYEAIGPVDALYLHGHKLSDFEREEILDFNKVYYVGDEAKKIDASRGAPRNHGFDDASGRYRARLLDHVAYRYKLCSTLGKGAFGDCFRAYDFAREQFVALKIIRNEPRFHRQGKVEVNVLSMLRNSDPDDEYALVHMIDSMIFRNHLCITFELLGNDLYSELRAGGFAGFEADDVRGITDDILRCLTLLADLKIVHADLKPENILLRPARTDDGAGPATPPCALGDGGRLEAKVIDFGSSCFQHGKVHSYIQSRYYRSPEVVLGLGYGPAIDMWSLGCILVELDSGSPLFPAKNEQDLLVLQTALLGLPQEDVLGRAKRAEEFFVGRRPLRTTDRKGRSHPVGSRMIEDAVRSTDPQFIDFVQRCLTWDPEERMTPAEALEHPWLKRTGSVELIDNGLEVESMIIDSEKAPNKLCGPLSDRRVAELIAEGTEDPLNDSGLSSGDEQEVPCTSKWMLSTAMPAIC